jgi:hypothetical protein
MLFPSGNARLICVKPAGRGLRCTVVRFSPDGHSVLIKRTGLRRALGAALVAAGALFMWLAPEAWSGLVLLAAGIGLEAVGITLEHRGSRPRNDSRATER